MPSDPVLIDKIKKEIFGRYNSGITPLRRAEIDNAIYDSDDLSKYFKSKLKQSPESLSLISRLFLRQTEKGQNPTPESVLQFIRKSLVLYKFPIKTYASGKSRIELISKFYEFNFSVGCNPESIYNDFFNKVAVVSKIRDMLVQQEIYPNRLLCECLLWAAFVVSEESGEMDDLYSESSILILRDVLESKAEAFELTDSHYAKEIFTRFSAIVTFVQRALGLNLSAYIQIDKVDMDNLLSEVNSNNNTYREELEKLESLRITKPDPSRNTIEDIVRAMNRSRFLIRPSYQRSEVINLAKSSAIIESMLLGIMLPAVFIYKRKNGVSEVIDGQQRLLTILGFIGSQYLDESGKLCNSKNHKFNLRNLRILTDLKGKNFENIDEKFKDRILEFDLFVVEIEERLNPDFNPVDLFIRLNDKPFPIRENSFEMWNSWVDKNVIDKIKSTVRLNSGWFYIKNTRHDKFRDRMNNEELYTTLSYFTYRKMKRASLDTYLDIYQKGSRINARIKRKNNITTFFQNFSEENTHFSDFMQSIDMVIVFINKIKILLGCSSDDELKEELEKIMSTGTGRKYFVRTLQDFYVLWCILDDIDITFSNRVVIYESIKDIFSYMKNIPEELSSNNAGYVEFNRRVKQLISEHST